MDKGWNNGTPGKDGYHTYFKEWADQDLRDMILRNRNRPLLSCGALAMKLIIQTIHTRMKY